MPRFEKSRDRRNNSRNSRRDSGNRERFEEFKDRKGIDRRDRGDRRNRGNRRDREDRRAEKTKVTCSECGKECEVPFKPRTDKPLFCDDCFKKKGKNKSSNINLDEINEKLDKIMKALDIE